MELKCHKCGKVWEYSGKNFVYATCPDCKSSVKIGDDNTTTPKTNTNNTTTNTNIGDEVK